MNTQPTSATKWLCLLAISLISSFQILSQRSIEVDSLARIISLQNFGTNNIFLSEIPNTWIVRPLGHSKPFNFMADQSRAINPYIFKADINPYFNFFSSPESNFAIFAVPRVKIRNFNSKTQLFSFSLDSTNNSLPVRTPSFMPAIKLYWAPIPHSKDDKNVYARKKSYSAKTPYYRRQQLFLQLTIEHHSNGQDGAEFDADSNPKFDNPDRVFNVTNGTFGKNLYGILLVGFSTITKFDRSPIGNLNFFFRRPVKSDYRKNKSAKKLPYWRRNIGPEFTTINSIQFGLEHQFMEYTPGLDLYYPKNFAHLKFNHSMFNAGKNNNSSEIQRLTIYAMIGLNDVLLFDNSSLTKRINMEVQYNWKIPFSPRGNLFFNAGYKGWDDYNIYFEDNYWFFNIGFSVFNKGFQFK